MGEGWCEMSAITQLAMTQLNVTDARCEALFASTLQPSDAPTAEMVAEAIARTVRRLGACGCVGQMAQEFGDHPGLAAERMRWARQLAAGVAIRPQAARRPSRAQATGGWR
jgi:hypothetical protein